MATSFIHVCTASASALESNTVAAVYTDVVKSLAKQILFQDVFFTLAGNNWIIIVLELHSVYLRHNIAKYWWICVAGRWDGLGTRLYTLPLGFSLIVIVNVAHAGGVQRQSWRQVDCGESKAISGEYKRSRGVRHHNTTALLLS